MNKFLSCLFMFTFTLVCFDKGDSFCVNPEHVVAVIKGAKGTMIVMEDSGELITNEQFDVVVKKLQDSE